MFRFHGTGEVTKRQVTQGQPRFTSFLICDQYCQT